MNCPGCGSPHTAWDLETSTDVEDWFCFDCTARWWIDDQGEPTPLYEPEQAS